jgi:NAD(P)-dependent dehydrogenase (short-subunit alcohol dehydrogenase family)
MGSNRTAVILGATGTVGRGIVRRLHASGWNVIAVARDEGKLASLASEVGGLTVISGSVDGDELAAASAASVSQVTSRIDAVVTAINIPPTTIRLLDSPTETLVDTFRGNVVTHLCAARAFLPLLSPGGRYVGIGGGMADFTFSGLGPVSMCQAAQRNLFRFLALETEGRDVSVVELMLFSNIVDPADDASASPREIRADEVGEHVRAVIEQPSVFPGPILVLKSRKQVGQAERPPEAS